MPANQISITQLGLDGQTQQVVNKNNVGSATTVQPTTVTIASGNTTSSNIPLASSAQPATNGISNSWGIIVIVILLVLAAWMLFKRIK